MGYVTWSSMRLGGWPAQLVCTMTCTSEISGNASKGIFRSDQIPASTSSSVATKTRNRFFAHQSIQRVTTLHSPRGIHADLFRGDGLPALFHDDGNLPRSTAIELAGGFVDSVPLVGESEWRTHRSHSHCRHGWHEEGDGDFGARNRGATRTADFHANRVAAFPWRTGFGCKFDPWLWRVHRARAPGSRGRWDEGTEGRLELAFGID